MCIELLSLPVDNELIQSNQAELSDIIRLALYQQHPNLFERLNFNDDRTFLEPSLFYYVSGKSTINLPIEQLLFGYMRSSDQPEQFKALTDPFGWINLPNYGYLKTNVLCGLVNLELNDGQFVENKIIQNNTVYPLAYSVSASFLITQSLPFILYTSTGTPDDCQKSTAETNEKYTSSLQRALFILKNHVTDFWTLMVNSVREISLFQSRQMRSMASISYFGTAFINTEGQPHNEVFFIEDLAHQCGHILFYALTVRTTQFLKILPQTRLSIYSANKHDTRDVYGAFHGLFTYTTILHCLASCLRSGVFGTHQRQEALARIGFYMHKFALDLTTMNQTDFFTSEGSCLYDAMQASFRQVQTEFGDHYTNYRYNNQPYIFNYSSFQEINPTFSFV